MKFFRSIFNNLLAKLISLVLAIATWFYVFDLINRDSYLQKDQTVESVFLRYKFGIKRIPVKPVFQGNSPNGYRANLERVKIEPSELYVFAPEDILSNLDEFRTDKIELGEYTRSTKISTGVRSNIKSLKMDSRAVDVYIPVESTAKPSEETK